MEYKCIDAEGCCDSITSCDGCDGCPYLNKSDDSPKITKAEFIKILKMVKHVKFAMVMVEREIEELKSMREKVTPSYSGVPGGGSDDKLTDLTAKIMELEQKQRDKIADYLQWYWEAEKYIELLDENDFTLANVLRLRYLEGERWEQIAVDLHYGYKYVFRLHNRGIKKIMQALKRIPKDT